MTLTPIGECVEAVRSWNPVREAAGQHIDYVDLGSVDNEQKLVVGAQRVIGREAPSRARQKILAGDILISTVRPYLNGVAQVPKHLNGATASTGFCVLRVSPTKVDPDYLFQWVKSPAFVADMVRKSTGASYPAVSDRIVCKSLIPLPPMPEQRRIAAILDQMDALRRQRRQSLSCLSKLEQALFYDTFGDPVANPKGWSIGTIRDLVAEAKYGTAQKANTDGLGLPILRMGNITYGGQIILDDLKHVELPEKDLAKYTTRRGDLLFNRTNSKELVGKTAVVNTNDPMAIASYLVRVRTNDQGNAHYISAYLNSEPGKAVLRNMCKNIVGIANINAQKLQDIAIALPPVTLQNDFAEQLSRIMRQREGFELAITASDSLFTSLQHRAFCGEL